MHWGSQKKQLSKAGGYDVADELVWELTASPKRKSATILRASAPIKAR